MKRANLFIVGAPKCGTTAWYEYLATHPSVFFTTPKEPHYFCTDFPNFRWYQTENEYERLFASVANESVLGDASPMYLYSKDAAKNIYAYNPNAKILVFVREQSAFLPSYHQQLVNNRDQYMKSFEEAWRYVPGTGRRSPRTTREESFLDYRAVGMFSEQIRRYMAVFPKDQITVIRFEDWTRNVRETYLSILGFLGLADDGRTEFPKVNSAKHYRFDLLARLTQQPPAWALRASKLARSLLQRNELGLATHLRRLNAVSGYKHHGPGPVGAEISSYFEAENAQLQALIQEFDNSGDP